MNVLLIGRSSSFVRLMIDKLNKEGHRIFVLTEDNKKVQGFKKVFETYIFSYDNECVGEVISSIKPDVTLYMGAFDTEFCWNEAKKTSISYISGLMNILMAFSTVGKGRFLYLSSEEVFTFGTDRILEEAVPSPGSAKGMAIAMGEEMCLDYRRMRHSDIVILRLGNLYGRAKDRKDLTDLCTRMCMEALRTGEVSGSAGERITLLHQADAVEFIYQVMAAESHAKDVYQITSQETLSTLEIARMIEAEMGKRAAAVERDDLRQEKPVLSNEAFAEEFGMRIVRRPEIEIPEIAAYMCRRPSLFLEDDYKPMSFLQRFCFTFRDLLRVLIPFLENMICFIPFFMLNNRAVGSQYFGKLDFYLLYVLLFAIIYGQQQATFSALLAVAGYCFRQMYHRSGFDVMLDYNTYVWIAQLLILGLVVGYMRDQLHAVKEEEVHEIDYLTGQLDHISDINVSNVRVKEILSDQIINQNDSFGKIYEITSSLDKYEPEEVLFYAADVLSKLMDSRDVAIYTVANRSYARLFSATSQKARCLGNSINYTGMSGMYETLAEKKVYINKDMNEAYPLMAAAIYAEEDMQLILMIWGIPWERMTLGQANRLTVIGYLIQNAVIRANRYLEALEQQRYIEGTSILEEQAFISLVRAFLDAEGKGLTECTVLSVDIAGMTQEDASPILSGKMRQTDYLGSLSDGKLYALLSNTRREDAEFVMARFREAGFESRIQEELGI